jgi:ATP-binding cassette, subfamily G (WHITE), member 2, PDR
MDLANGVRALSVIAVPDTLPHFWLFMYRVSPFSYLVGAMLSTGLSGTKVICAENEYLRFSPPPTGETCGEYMQLYMYLGGGYLDNPQSTSECAFCPINDTDTFLQSISVDPADAWRNFGLLWVYVAFNIATALFMYWLLRVPKCGRRSWVIDRLFGTLRFSQYTGPTR